MSDTPETDLIAKRYDANEIGAAEVLIYAARLERENAALRAALDESEWFARSQGQHATVKVRELIAENAALREALARWQKLADMGLEDVVPLWMRGTVANIAGQGDNALSLRQSRDHLPHGGLPETTGGDRTADGKEAQP